MKKVAMKSIYTLISRAMLVLAATLSAPLQAQSQTIYGCMIDNSTWSNWDSSEGINGYRTTSINDSITPSKDDCIVLAQKAGLPPAEAIDVYNKIEILTKPYKKQ